MSRRDFEMLARVIRQSEVPREHRLLLAKELAEELHNHFAGFDKVKFIESCV